MLDRVRLGIGPVRFDFRCDSPDERRLLQMQITARGAGAVVFEVSSLATQSRPEVPLLRRDAPRTESVLRMCAWCKRVAMPDGVWIEVEDAIAAMNLFQASRLPGVSHGICEPCSEVMMEVLTGTNRAPLRAGGSR